MIRYKENFIKQEKVSPRENSLTIIAFWITLIVSSIVFIVQLVIYIRT